MTRYGDSAQKINDLRTPRSFIRLHAAFYFPLRGESRDVSAVPVKTVCILTPLQHTAMRAQSAPGFPCALVSREFGRMCERAVAHQPPVAGIEPAAPQGD